MRRTMEVVVLALVCLSPWPFGSASPRYEFLLDLGVATLTVLWGARMLLEGELSWRKCPVTACLAALVLIGLWQTIPLPRGLLGRIAPTTARLYHQLLPAHPEILPAGEPREDPEPPAGTTLSFDPGSTRTESARLLAIVLLFAIVADQVASASSLRRLCLAALINGSLLALFGLVQSFSSDPQNVYWTITTAGAVFGPFINRNHYAFYLNLCIGAATGLLLARLADRGPGLVAGRGQRFGPRPSWGPLPEPESLGIIFALALMASSVVVCLSRGGLLALAGGSIFGLLLWLQRSGQSSRSRIILLAPAAVLVLVAWLGLDRVAERLETLRGGEVLKEGRLVLWSDALPLVRDFPLWGTGLGTYQYMEMLHRSDARFTGVNVEHAHNDYLEVLVEAGLPGLIAGVAALVLIFRLGLRAIRRGAGTPAGGLALGALIGVATVAIHSVTDFSLHIPANAVFATVLCAQLCALGREDAEGASQAAAVLASAGPDPHRVRLRLRGLAPVLGAVLVVAPGLAIAEHGWRKARAHHLRLAAADEDRSGDAGRYDRKVAQLERAADLTPGDASLQADAAYAHISADAQQRGVLSARGPAAEARPGRAHLTTALRHFLRSRDLCPVRAMAHLDLAGHVDDFPSAEPQSAYLRRVQLLAPTDYWLWYQCGNLALAAGRRGEAWADWRRSLELSSTQLPDILDRCREQTDTRDILRAIIPDRPDLLLEAARYLFPQSEEGRRPFLERALVLLERGSGPPSAEALHTRATIRRALGRPAGALKDYRAALLREPGRIDWRYELAELSYEQGRYEESHQELLTILAFRPKDVQARTLLEAVARGLAEHR